MALPMLINGADCGPINPLQSLGKRFDQDRGIQQVRTLYPSKAVPLNSVMSFRRISSVLVVRARRDKYVLKHRL
jgi:hypothetical protein